MLVVLLFVLWVAAVPPDRLPGGAVDVERLLVFFGGFAALVAIPAIAARMIVRRVNPHRVWGTLRQFHLLIEAVKLAIAVWFAFGLFGNATWVNAVGRALGPAGATPFMLPGMLLGPLPAVLALFGVWWAQFPIDRLAREQSVLPLLESDLPIHAPPTLLKFFANNLRLQILVTAVPLLMIALLRDSAALAMLVTGLPDPRKPTVGTGISLAAAAVVLVVAPEALRHILRTERLPASALRWRLDHICRATRTRYRDVLLWNTGYAMGNAAVMGVLPRLRYVLLSDLLLESMTDRQIEGVFAHELGHVVYRHTLWFVAVIVTLVLGMSAAAEIVLWQLRQLDLPGWLANSAMTATSVGWVALAFAAFGFVSRRFERQADVYAARVMQNLSSPATAANVGNVRTTAVGPEGAEIVASALARAATINNMPLSARSFRHGSTARRIDYLRRIARDPDATFAFDRFMIGLFVAIVVGFVLSAAVVGWIGLR
jgi:STE24 endopeptidase